jgi:SAM-dependent methyltransferase
VEQTSYDNMPYPGQAHAHTHPNRVAAIARLFGVDAPKVATARVLEIACGDGANLIPIAYSLPRAHCVGFDLAPTAVARGQERVTRLGLKNCEISVADLVSVGTSLGEFDYVIAHGLYSWVPAPLRDALLKLIAAALAPAGVAFVSYNTYPGWHLSRMVREMIRFHTREIQDPAARIAQARALLRFVAAAQNSDDADRRALAAECERMATHEPGYMFHDDLADVNDPVYFHEFVAHARRFGLDFVAEADFASMTSTQFPEAARAKLDELRGEPVLHAQYMDFLTCRRFRQTLLSRTGDTRAASPILGATRNLHFASAGRPDVLPIDFGAGVEVQFRWGKRTSLKTDHPLAKAVFLALGQRWPEALCFDDVLAAATRLVGFGSAEDAATLERILLAGFGLRMVDASIEPWLAVSAPSASPRASALARLDAESSNIVTSLMQRRVGVEEPLILILLRLCDGSRDRQALLAELCRHDPNVNDDAVQQHLAWLALVGLMEA